MKNRFFIFFFKDDGYLYKRRQVSLKKKIGGSEKDVGWKWKRCRVEVENKTSIASKTEDSIFLAKI